MALWGLTAFGPPASSPPPSGPGRRRLPSRRRLAWPGRFPDRPPPCRGCWPARRWPSGLGLTGDGGDREEWGGERDARGLGEMGRGSGLVGA